MCRQILANDKHTVLKKLWKNKELKWVDLILEWNRFGHEDYWESAREGMETFDGIDDVFGTDQLGTNIMHLALESRNKRYRKS